MIKAFSAIFISFVVFSSCHKGGGCDPGMMNQKFDIGVYRGPDMRPEADYVSIDGSQQTLITTPEGSAGVTCSTTGILHYSLSLGTHTVTIYLGANSSNGTSHTLILSKGGATLDGTQLSSQSCNNGLSVMIEDI